MEKKASLCERLANATLGLAAIAGSCSMQPLTYGILNELSKEPTYLGTSGIMLGATFFTTIGVLGIIGGYRLLKYAKTGEK